MRPLLPAAALALLAACAPPPEPPTPAPAPVEVTTTSTEAYEKYTEAWRLVVEGEDRRVIIAPLREALALDPEFAMAWRLLAASLRALRDSSEAEGALEHAVRLRDRVSEAERLHIEASDAHSRNDLEATLSAYDRILDLNSRDVLAQFNRGVTLRQLGRDAEALDAYDRVIQLNPRFRSAHTNRAAALRRLGRYAESFESFKRGSFGRMLEQYLTYGPQKAFALARDSAGRWVSGQAFRYPTNAEAILEAVTSCINTLPRYRVRSPCWLYAVGDEVVWENVAPRSTPVSVASGTYSLSFNAAATCSELPADRRNWTYTARILQRGAALDVVLDGASFWQHPALGQLNRFAGAVFQDRVIFGIQTSGWGIVEEITPTTYLEIIGVAQGTVSDSMISGTVDGGVGLGEDLRDDARHVWCDAVEFTLTRR